MTYDFFLTYCSPESAVAKADQKREFILGYAQKFWEAGNSTVVILFAVAFGIYVLLAQYPDIRDLLERYWKPMFWISLAGNLGILVLIYRLGCNEMKLLRYLTIEKAILEPVWSGVELRWALVGANFVMYAVVLELVVRYVRKRRNSQNRT